MPTPDVDFAKTLLADGRLRERCSEKTKMRCFLCGYNGESPGNECAGCGSEKSLHLECFTCKAINVTDGERECSSLKRFLDTGESFFPKDSSRKTKLGAFLGNLGIAIIGGIFSDLLLRCYLLATGLQLNTIIYAHFIGIYSIFILLINTKGPSRNNIFAMLTVFIFGFLAGLATFGISYWVSFAIVYLVCFYPGLGFQWNIFEIRNPPLLDQVFDKVLFPSPMFVKFRKIIQLGTNRIIDFLENKKPASK